MSCLSVDDLLVTTVIGGRNELLFSTRQGFVLLLSVSKILLNYKLQIFGRLSLKTTKTLFSENFANRDRKN